MLFLIASTAPPLEKVTQVILLETQNAFALLCNICAVLGLLLEIYNKKNKP